MSLVPIYRAGAFVGFSALIAGELTPPQPYKFLMIALEEVSHDDGDTAGDSRLVESFHLPTPAMADRRKVGRDVAV
jgi:hypothetical protein